MTFASRSWHGVPEPDVDVATSPVVAGLGAPTSRIRVGADGVLYRDNGQGGGFVAVENWLENGQAYDTEVQVRNVAGGFSSGPVDTWLPVNVDRDWTKTATAGFTQVSATMEWRNLHTLAILGSCQIILNAST